MILPSISSSSTPIPHVKTESNSFYSVAPSEIQHNENYKTFQNVKSLMSKKMIDNVELHLATETSSIEFPGVNVEEIIIYFLLFLLIAFLLFYVIKCVRITLDPYNIARVAWLETLDKRDSKLFRNNGLRSSAPN